LRSKRRHILYHGTLLYDFPLPLISQLLRMPPRQPDYRAGRSHSDFVVNLDLDVASLQGMLIEQWQAEPSSDDWPQQRTEQLVGERYGELGV
jgi:lipoate-protein ligase A